MIRYCDYCECDVHRTPHLFLELARWRGREEAAPEFPSQSVIACVAPACVAAALADVQLAARNYTSYLASPHGFRFVGGTAAGAGPARSENVGKLG